MVQEEIIVQTADEVAQIDYRRLTNDIITAQTDEIQNNINNISEQLDVIIDNTNSNTYTYNTPISSDIDLSNVTDLIEDIDTTIVEANTQDILIKLGQQQEQINDINNKLDLILSKL